MTLGIAIVGCGYVADSYRYCLQLHYDKIHLTGVYDRDADRLSAFSGYWGDRRYASLDQVLADEDCQILINLTDPENHEPITRAGICAGKHVYSEKPLALTKEAALELQKLATSNGVQLGAAPCNFLGEAVQTAWKVVRDGVIGKVRLVYAELDDGLIHRADYANWISRSGRAWPARGEFETGCTYEHAGYALGPLVAMFGPVKRVSAFSSVLIADKQTTPPLDHPAPDFSSGCLEFEGGLVARVTNSIVAPYDHRFRIIGEDGTLEITEVWDYSSSIRLRDKGSNRIARFFERRFPALNTRRVPLVRKSPLPRKRGTPTMDFMRGVEELAAAINEGRTSKLNADLSVHLTEVTEMLQYPERFGAPAAVQSSCPKIDPEDWANDA